MTWLPATGHRELRPKSRDLAAPTAYEKVFLGPVFGIRQIENDVLRRELRFRPREGRARSPLLLIPDSERPCSCTGA